MEEWFEQCSRSAAAHRKAIITLQRMISESEKTKSTPEMDDHSSTGDGLMALELRFFGCVAHALLCGRRDARVERTLQFVSQFVSTLCTSSSPSTHVIFMETFLLHLISVGDSEDRAVRFRTCQLLSLVLQKLDEDCQLRSAPTVPVDHTSLIKL